MIYLIRASHANEFELQNYAPIANKLQIEAITSQYPLTSVPIPSSQLWSPTDLPDLFLRRQILNRLIGGEQWLFGLEEMVGSRSNGSNHRTIIHTAETYTPYTHQSVELRKSGAISKLVCTCWETIPHGNEKFSRLRKWKSEAYKYVDLFHTPTDRAKQALITEGVDPSKIVVIPYGVDITRFCSQSLRGETLKGKRCVVLTVARLEKEKGMEDLEIVAKSLPQYDFLVLGRGSYVPQGTNIKISSVPYSEIHKVYQKADLFFLPSRSTPTWEEQYGMALVEAMACGLPLVTTNSGAIPEIVGDAGIKVPELDTKAMSQGIFEILSTKLRATCLGNASKHRAAQHFDSIKTAEKLAALYK